MIKSEYEHTFMIDGQEFVAKKGFEYSLWTLTSGSYTFPGQYTSITKAKAGAHNILQEKLKKRPGKYKQQLERKKEE